jgi:acyl-CoA thioester hydrolase
MRDWVETGRPVAHPWFCDTMGHLNVRHYAAMFDDASFQFLGMLAPRAWLDASALGWADAKITIEFRQEVEVGACMVIRTQLVRLGGKSFTYLHEMHDAETGRLHATCETVTVLFDLTARRAVPIEGDLRRRAEQMFEVPL